MYIRDTIDTDLNPKLMSKQLVKGARVRTLKVALKGNATSDVSVGSSYIGNLKNNLVVGQGFVLTTGSYSSLVTKITPTKDNRFLVSTMTSVYLIEEV